MRDSPALRAAEEWARANPPSPTARRDAWLGWLGAVGFAIIFWSVFQ